MDKNFKKTQKLCWWSIVSLIYNNFHYINTQQHGQYVIKGVTSIKDVNEEKCVVKAIPDLFFNNFEFSPDGLENGRLTILVQVNKLI